MASGKDIRKAMDAVADAGLRLQEHKVAEQKLSASRSQEQVVRVSAKAGALKRLQDEIRRTDELLETLRERRDALVATMLNIGAACSGGAADARKMDEWVTTLAMAGDALRKVGAEQAELVKLERRMREAETARTKAELLKLNIDVKRDQERVERAAARKRKAVEHALELVDGLFTAHPGFSDMKLSEGVDVQTRVWAKLLEGYRARA